jgi:replicative DNA helicase
MSKQTIKKQDQPTDFMKEFSIADGKKSPASIEFEAVIIGTCLIDTKGLERCIFIFGENADIFYDLRHSIIWGIIWELYKRELPVDLLTVIMEAKRRNDLTRAGGDKYIIDLTLRVSSSTHIEYHARIVMEKYFARTMQQHCAGAMLNLYKENTDVFEQMDEVRGVVQRLEDMINQQKGSVNSNEAYRMLMEDYNSNTPPVMPCDYKDLKEQFNGGQAGDFILLGARPSIGKTAVALNFAVRTALQKIGVGMFCLEMSTVQMQKRVAANVCDVSFYRLNRKILTDAELQRMYGSEGGLIEGMPLYFDESRNLLQILSKIRIMAKNGVKTIIIDYLQIVTTVGMKFGTREQELAFISRSLKAIALELQIVVIALAQLSKEIDKRPVKRPISSDLRESNALENDADIIILLYRPEFYGVNVWDRSWDGVQELPTAGEIELIFSKYRNGSPFTQRLRFWGDKMRLADFNSDADYLNSNRTYNDNGEAGRKDLPAESIDDDFEF